VDRNDLRSLLEQVAGGTVTAEDAAGRLVGGPLGAAADGVTDLGFARVDTHRQLRTGDPEVVYAAGKTAEQTVAIVEALVASGARPVLVTRAPDPTREALLVRFPDAEVSGATVAVGPLPEPTGLVAVVAAGTSDAEVAEEAALTARAFGAGVERITDVGVAGLHRLLAVRDRLEAADCLVVLAGMEGALPSVVGGLVGTPQVAVPTSVGYGASFGGLAALLAMLNSCAPGVVVCNIDNGFGAGVFAARVARRSAPR
jgi:NCAIR mutase (PurE)-related protein